jgi:hypothetical protein
VSWADVQPRYDFYRFVVALAVKVADGQQVHAVEGPREEQGDE